MGPKVVLDAESEGASASERDSNNDTSVHSDSDSAEPGIPPLIRDTKAGAVTLGAANTITLPE